MSKHFRELRAEERRYDGGRRLVSSQTMGVGGAGYAGLEQSVVTVYGYERFHYEGDEAQVVGLSATGTVEQYARVGHQTPVVVLARTVDA